MSANRMFFTRRPRTESGFTLVELMVTLVVFAVVLVVIAAIVINVGHSRDRTVHRAETVQAARTAVDLIARDLRSAGYDADRDAPVPQPAIAYIDSAQVVMSEDQQPYPDTLAAGPQDPQAFDPAKTPRPKPLDGTAWTPPQKYTTGAELIRYTLDVNNDGVVDAADISSPQGSDAASTPNPNDYVLVREVYGANGGGNNGGAQERVALVRRPGGGVPPLFTVYLKGFPTPWDWANGPIPTSKLDEIQRIEVSVTATAGKPEADRSYAQTTISTQVNSMRSVPDFGLQTFVVSGYVFNDLDKSGTKDATEPGLAGVTVRLGNYVGYTSPTGFYSIRAANGVYTLRHEVPPGFQPLVTPDSTVVTVNGGPVSHSFPDIALPGGWVTMHAWQDDNANQLQDAGEINLAGIKFTMTPGGQVAYTDPYGLARLFAGVGSFTATATVPDSMIATTPITLTGTMVDGDSARASVGMMRSANGFITGQVFRDNNRNGVPDGTDAGISNVWVGATTDGGVTILGYVYTDASGNFKLVVPANDPPHTTPYSVFIVPPAGFYPTNSTTISNVWVQAGTTVPGNNFGMASYQIITLNASRVLSLASRDLIENDWNGSHTENARQDVDLVLGADAGGTDNVSVWFNQYASTPLFNPSPTYARNAPNSVMAMALDTLDKNPPVARPDLVTGTKISTAGNFFLWLNQGSNNNEGYFPSSFTSAYRTADGGDVQSVLSFDCAGGPMPDLIVGTKSPTAGMGTIEIWQNDDGVTPTFSRQEIYPTGGGSIPGNTLGEVTCMTLADLDNDGRKDLIVGTKDGVASGSVLLFQNVSKLNGARFVCKNVITIADGYVTALGTVDVNSDGQMDIMVGTHYTSSAGKLIYLQNKNSMISWAFLLAREVDAPGIVMSMTVADLGGGSVPDLIVGWRATDTGYGGGVAIYYLDLGNLPATGVDPSAGAILNMVPASTAANFNYGLNTVSPPTPYLTDFAVGIKSSPTTGAVVVFIR